MTKHPYPPEMHFRRDLNTRSSAEVILPLVLGRGSFRSVADIGCGVGTWLAVAQSLGVDEVLGVEGEWVDEAHLEISKDRLVRADLTKPLELEQKFDLVISLEVAEHLPKNCAEHFVKSLTSLGPVVLFSAAIPFQGGQGHFNEQWPDYWAQLFREYEFVVIDCLRREIWNDNRVRSWYRQNALLFVRQDVVENNPTLASELEKTHPDQLDIVHPKLYERNSNLEAQSLPKVLKAVPTLLSKAAHRKASSFASIFKKN